MARGKSAKDKTKGLGMGDPSDGMSTVPSDNVERGAQAKVRAKEMHSSLTVWTDSSYRDEPLAKIRECYVEYLRTREKPASDGTVQKAQNTLLSFSRSVAHYNEPLTLSSLTPGAVNRWLNDQRKRGLSEHGIASRLSTLKAFARKYLHKYLEIIDRDPLEKVARITPPEKPSPRFAPNEVDTIFDTLDGPSFAAVRNKAMIATYLATGRRFKEVLDLTMQDIDLISGEMCVVAKGGDVQIAYISPDALKIVRRYAKMRPRNLETNRLWVTEMGKPLSYWGGQSVFRRLKERTGIEDFHSHRFRHNFAQTALDKGAGQAEVQDMLGHKTPAMTRRYTASVRQANAARTMPQYSPI